MNAATKYRLTHPVAALKAWFLRIPLDLPPEPPPAQPAPVSPPPTTPTPTAPPLPSPIQIQPPAKANRSSTQHPPTAPKTPAGLRPQPTPIPLRNTTTVDHTPPTPIIELESETIQLETSTDLSPPSQTTHSRPTLVTFGRQTPQPLPSTTTQPTTSQPFGRPQISTPTPPPTPNPSTSPTGSTKPQLCTLGRQQTSQRAIPRNPPKPVKPPQPPTPEPLAQPKVVLETEGARRLFLRLNPDLQTHHANRIKTAYLPTPPTRWRSNPTLLSPFDFEQYVGERMAEFNQVAFVTNHSGDEGLDVIVQTNVVGSTRRGIQVKMENVDNSVLDALYKTITYWKTPLLMIITTKTCNDICKLVAQQAVPPVLIIEGHQLDDRDAWQC